MYKQVFDQYTKSASTFVIQKVDTNTFIPINPDNTDYQAYLAWLEEGNTPLPADE
jgi:hypothetical protein